MKMNLVTITALLAASLVTLPGCCGLLSDDRETHEIEEREKPEEPRTPPGSDFEGTFEMVNEEYDDLSLKISREGKYYVLAWGIPASEPWFAYGVKVGDYLGACMTEGEDIMLGIYKRDGDGITGLWDIYGEFVYDLTEDARKLKLSRYDFEGRYEMESPDPETDETHYFELVIKKAGDLYSVTEAVEAEYEITGSGLAVDDVIVMGFPVGGTAIVKMYRLRGSRLDGKLFYSYYDDETGRVKTEVSEEKGKKQ